MIIIRKSYDVTKSIDKSDVSIKVDANEIRVKTRKWLNKYLEVFNLLIFFLNITIYFLLNLFLGLSSR